MKRFVVAAVALASCGLSAALSPASAADIPMRAPEAMPVKAPGILPFNWGGWYAGLNLGGGFSDVSGVVFGGQIGYNWQFNRWVFGVETDIQFSAQDETDTFMTSIGVPLSVKQELDWFGTFRGRLGYTVWDRWLPYITGGLAYGGRSASSPALFSTDDTSVGWTIGVGVDYAITHAWVARLEYLHISLDDFSPTVVPGVTVGLGRLDNDIIRGAVNYRFLPY